MENWMYWLTAVVFTILGYCLSMNHSKKVMVQLTIDNLITQGYLKTRGTGEDMQLVKVKDD